MWEFVLFTWCCLTLVAVADRRIVTEPISARIINGTQALKGQFPYQVSLRHRYKNNHFCGGSILTFEWILTAGHCTFEDIQGDKKPLEANLILVVAGDTTYKDINYAYKWSPVDEIVLHPKFDINLLRNDIALLKLKKPFQFDRNVNAVQIAPHGFNPGTNCYVSGWGSRSSKNIVSSQLMYVELLLLDHSTCRKFLKNLTTLTPGQFCAGYEEGGRDACAGDSGGGLLCEGYLLGVVSAGHGCALPKKPGVYADAHYYLPWMKRHVDFEKRSNDSDENPIFRTFHPILAGLKVFVWTFKFLFFT